MSVANYVEILKKIECDTASRGEWCQLSRNMIAALPERLYRRYPLGLQEVAPKKRDTRFTLCTDEFRDPECSSSNGSDSEAKGEEDNDSVNCDLEQHANNPYLPSLPPGALVVVRPEIETEVLAFIATMRVCKTPWPHNCP